MNHLRRWVIGGGIVALLVGSFVMRSESDFAPPQTEYGERIDGGYYSLIRDDGSLVGTTALIIGVGDQYINEGNELFEVARFDGDKAIVGSLGIVEMPDVSDVIRVLEELDQSNESSQSADQATAAGFQILDWLRAAAGQSQAEVGIYHTHNAESYEPTSGTAFKDRGDIYEVGRALADALEQRGISVTRNESSHLPHDGQAYLRSRRTAIQLSRKRPKTILDLHRDAIPDPNEYTASVDGEVMSKVRLVVGRQNQNREANLEYAKRIKAIADERYPGLIMGIFNARGNYNQDLGPRMMLLEFGTHVTSLEQALKSVEPMAEVIAAAAGITPGTGSGEVGSAGSRTALWIVVLAIVAGVAWVMINKEGWQGVKNSLSRLSTKVGRDKGDDRGHED